MTKLSEKTQLKYGRRLSASYVPTIRKNYRWSHCKVLTCIQPPASIDVVL